VTKLTAAVLSVLGVLVLGSPGSAGPRAAHPGHDHVVEPSSSPIDPELRKRMTGKSWHEGCPVGIGKLRLLEVPYWGFDGEIHRGRLVVHRRVAKDVLSAMETLFNRRFQIRRMVLVDRYGADDHRSMNADNTSAFNCRFIAGQPGVWSEHAYGRAIDINPVENPYVSGSHVSPPAGRPYVDRSRNAKGMIHHGDEVWDAFRDVGWRWGGDWSGTKDYQHFSSTGN
jgi:D-alanyl-D-alanine carboxypeptidase